MGVVIFFLGVLALLMLVSIIFNIAFALLIPLFFWMLAGMFAGRIVRGRGFGPVKDIILGIVGGIVGGWVLGGIFGINLGDGILWQLLIGIIGAVLTVYVARMFNPGIAR